MPAHINYRNGEAGLIVDSVVPIEQAADLLTKAVHIRMNTLGLERERVEELASVLGGHPGNCDVYLHCATPGAQEVTVHATAACTVAPSTQLVAQVEELFGEDALWFSAGNGYPRHHN